MPSGAGRTHFMMQYYAYILMFVVFDVMAIFLYIWGVSLFSLPRSATLPIIGFLGDNVCYMGYSLYLAGEKGNLVAQMILTMNKYLASRGGVRFPQ